MYRCNIVERNKAEKEGAGASLGPPPISYEAFVEDLDEKDPFTNAVVEALVNVRYSLVIMMPLC